MSAPSSTPPSSSSVGTGGHGSDDHGNSISTVASIDPEHVEKLLVDELNSLSHEERNRISEEIHGISSLEHTETVEFLQESLARFEIELRNRLAAYPVGVYDAATVTTATATSQPAHHQQPKSVSFGDGCRVAFQMYTTQHEQLNRRLYCNGTLGYIQQSSFLLKFLRAELFNIHDAVSRYIRHVDMLYKLFGLEALWRPLMFDDLTKCERGFLQSGMAQLLPSRERGRGRRVIIILPSFANERQIERVSGLKFEGRLVTIHYQSLCSSSLPRYLAILFDF